MSTQSSLMHEERLKAAPSKKRGKKTFEVWWRAKPGRSSLWFKDWTRFGKYRDEATAQQVVRQKSSDRYFEYEVRHAA